MYQLNYLSIILILIAFFIFYNEFNKKLSIADMCLLTIAFIAILRASYNYIQIDNSLKLNSKNNNEGFVNKRKKSKSKRIHSNDNDDNHDTNYITLNSEESNEYLDSNNNNNNDNNDNNDNNNNNDNNDNNNNNLINSDAVNNIDALLGIGIHNKEMLADAWCKVKTMIQATKSKKYSNIKIFIYMDSDAVISKTYENKSLSDMLYVLQNRLKWDPNNKPMIFNQDGPCWWCNQVAKVGYTTCLNAGTVLWYNDHEGKSLNILNEWWNAALDSYKGESNPFRRKFRINWPWEQDRQMAIYHRNPKHIQIASQPLKAHIDINAGHDDWCLSHLAKSGCYISHHCEDKRSKKHMMNMYGMIEEESAHIPVQYLDKEV